jgi:hypothetical protein
VPEGLRGGDARAQRGGEESADGCGEDPVRASAFYRGWREAVAPEQPQWPAMKVLVTHSEEGGFTTELRRGRGVVGVSPWRGRRAARWRERKRQRSRRLG